jgi:hypothetical protein
MATAPHQSYSRRVRFPGAAIAARELGVHRGHLHRVLSGQRTSAALLSRWQGWLAQHPEFSLLQLSSRNAQP